MNPILALLSPHRMMRNLDWRGFILKWTFLTVIIAVLIGYVGTFTLDAIGTMPVDVLHAKPGPNHWLFAAILLGVGTAAGLLQSVALYRLLPGAHLWVLATAGGSALAAIVGFILFNENWVVTAAMALLLILILQTVVLNRVTEPRLRWIAGNLASMIPAVFAGVTFYWLVAGLVARFTSAAILAGHPASGMAFSLPFIAPFGLIYGVLSGDLLAWILANKLRRDEGVPLIWLVN